MKNTFIRLNEKDVIFELIDGEIVLLNLTNGNYYTIDGLGVLIWGLIIKSGDSEKIIEYIFKLYKNSVKIELVKKIVLVFIDELINAKLLSIVDEKQLKSGLKIHLDFNDNVLPAFKKPILQSYQQMQEKYAHPSGIKRSDE
ncbi:MAG: PqqD family protein [Saprospiraceae bacterium]|nr:PqqD family protein [Saprospiraceae bacterium]